MVYMFVKHQFTTCIHFSINKVFTSVSGVADTDGLLGVVAAVTTSCKLPRAPGAVRTHAGTTVVT